jgi:hypothetical protein
VVCAGEVAKGQFENGVEKLIGLIELIELIGLIRLIGLIELKR